jgi:hypothetical protein
LCRACADPAHRRGPHGLIRHTHWLRLDADGCTLALPELDPNLARGALGSARDGAELLAALGWLDNQLGPWRGTGGATGLALLRLWLKNHALYEAEPSLPPIKTRPEPDFGWIRPLGADELARRWVYCFDKHNQYLVAAGTVEVGGGALELRNEPTFHARTPGYWYVKTAPWPADRRLPDPTYGGRRREAAEFRWLTTPTVEAALSAGSVEAIAAAWYWPTHGRWLAPVASQLRACLARARGGIAFEATKSIYRELLGGYLAAEYLHERGDPLWRPDWRDMLKAEARCRLWYSLRPLEAAGVAPFAIATDAIYLASDADTPHAALRGLLVLGQDPRQWACKARVPLVDCEGALTHLRGLTARVRALAGLPADAEAA